ncbi:MAG: hypothetical protein IJ747_04525 [Lachnospiraceae bacterium]|nr:hypothetical protein [Lachnospiraceae bacterium]
MQTNLEQILDGKYDYESSSLDFSCAKVELSMHSGEVVEGSFHVYSAEDCFTKGYVSSTDMRMECLTKEFSGSGEEILFRFHGEHLTEGDVVKGSFCVVSNQGEYYLPFVVSVEYEVLDSSVGGIKNLFHFANLAKSNWQEAVKLFYSADFARVFANGDGQFLDCYRGLSAVPGNEQNVEEFLIQINKKQKIQYLVRESEIKKELPDNMADAVVEMELNITRNGWGYTTLQAECEGDFLFVARETLRDEDFLGNKCALPVFVDMTKCRVGRNFGRIYLYNSYVSITVPVMIRRGERSVIRQGRRKRKQEIVELMEVYQNFRVKRMDAAAWMKETEKLLESMLARDEDDIAARLFHAQLLISMERYNEAEWTLDHAVDLMESSEGDHDVLYAYYLYLTTLIERREEYVNQITEQVKRIYAQHREDWQPAWLLLYLSEEYSKTPAAKWDFLLEQLESGCSSPVFYIEGLHVLNTNPTFLRRLDDTMLQMLYYGVRKDILGKELTEQIIYLAGRSKETTPILCKLLERLYEKRPDERILQQICTILVRDNCVGRKYAPWYEAGVEAQLRITNLYEYYLMSVDPWQTPRLPRILLMYFSYQNNLDLTHRAFLYWYVEQHKLELGELYDSFRPHMEHFIVDQIRKERISRHLAFLYQRLLTPAMIDEQTAQVLAKLLFAHRICVEDLRLKKVIVYQPGNLSEHSYTLQNGVAWVPIYGMDTTLLFEDAYGNRFVKSAEHTMEKMMIPGKYLRGVAALVQDCRELDLYILHNSPEHITFTAEMTDRVRRLAADEQVEERIRRSLYLKLLQHYYDADNIKALDECLAELPAQMFEPQERAQILRYTVLRDRMEDAWEWLITYGPFAVDQKTLMRLVDDRIDHAQEEDPYLTDVTLYTFFRGKYDSRMVQYLEQYADCPTRELRDIWKAACSFDVDAYRLSERILQKMLFSGAFVGEKMDIFAYYVARGTTGDVEEAFLARCAYDYFVKDRVTEDIVFRQIGRMAEEKDPARVCKLAYLKYYAENGVDITDREGRWIATFLHELLTERIHLNFFRNYLGNDKIHEPMLSELMDKTIVEYRASAGGKATIHYVIMREDGVSSEYLAEPMREVFGGVCYKEFVLFFGETLQYYIMEERNGEEQLTESGNLQKSDIHNRNTDWRYEMINDILISRTLEDFDTLDGLLDEYYRRAYLGEHLFALQ